MARVPADTVSGDSAVESVAVESGADAHREVYLKVWLLVAWAGRRPGRVQGWGFVDDDAADQTPTALSAARASSEVSFA